MKTLIVNNYSSVVLTKPIASSMAPELQCTIINSSKYWLQGSWQFHFHAHWITFREFIFFFYKWNLILIDSIYVKAQLMGNTVNSCSSWTRNLLRALSTSVFWVSSELCVCFFQNETVYLVLDVLKHKKTKLNLIIPRNRRFQNGKITSKRFSIYVVKIICFLFK